MSCLHPINLRVKNNTCNILGYKQFILVPCGKCVECLKRKQNDWSVRCMEQFKSSKFGCFVTLTYRDDNVPTIVNVDTGERFLSVNKRDVQLWLKRSRIRLANNGYNPSNLKYFITSEYGPRTLRPHYHAFICGFSLDVLEFCGCLNDWREHHGFVSAKNIKCSDDDVFSCARYVGKYCSKGFFENPLVEKGIVNKTFHLISKGFGKSYVDTRKVEFDYYLKKYEDTSYYRYSDMSVLFDKLRYFYVTSKGVSCFALPRYYKEKFIPPKSHLSYRLQNFIRERILDMADDKFRRYKAEFGLSDYETSRLVFEDELYRNNQSEQDSIKKMRSFYFKSKI